MWSPIDRVESNHKPRFQTGDCGAMTVSNSYGIKCDFSKMYSGANQKTNVYSSWGFDPVNFIFPANQRVGYEMWDKKKSEIYDCNHISSFVGCFHILTN